MVPIKTGNVSFWVAIYAAIVDLLGVMLLVRATRGSGNEARFVKPSHLSPLRIPAKVHIIDFTAAECSLTYAAYAWNLR